jgi:ketosteroid isomerase-like protein
MPSNLDRAREGLDRWARGDFSLDETLIHPDIVWETNWPGLAPAVYGYEGVQRFADESMAPMDMTFTPLEVSEIDAANVLLGFHIDGRGRESGIEVEMDVWDVWSFRDGRMVRRQTFRSRDEALAAVS